MIRGSGRQESGRTASHPILCLVYGVVHVIFLIRTLYVVDVVQDYRNVVLGDSKAACVS